MRLPRRAWSRIGPTESLLASREAYQDPATGQRMKPGAKLGDTYQAKSLPVAKQRLYRAGARLAWTLNEAFAADSESFVGSKAGDEREAAGIRLCWCPAGQFLMGSPLSEPDRRPDEDQVEVTLTKGFWMAKDEVTQGQWKRIIGKLPGEPTAELPEGDDLPVGNVNFVEAEGFCRKLTEQARASGDLPAGWQIRLPTEAQWEYACRGDHDGHGVRRQAQQ